MPTTHKMTISLIEGDSDCYPVPCGVGLSGEGGGDLLTPLHLSENANVRAKMQMSANSLKMH